MDWRMLVAAVMPSILVLGFLLLQYQLIDSPKRWEFDLLTREVRVLRQNFSSLQQSLREVQRKLPRNFSKLPKFQFKTMMPEEAITKRCLEISRAMLPVASRGGEQGTACRYFHFIHVAKNGGTALEEWLQDNDLRCLFRQTSFGHRDMQIEFPNRPKGTCYLTLVRDPVERWVSGFLSRLRKGCPAFCSNWTEAEEKVFQMFRTPNELAEAFSSKDSTVRNAADMAHATVTHLFRGYATYFPYGQIMMPHLIFAGLTCKLETDAFELLRAIGVPDEVILGVSPIKRVHQNPVSHRDLQNNLSPLALQNIRRKVQEDYDTLKLMAEEKLIESSNISSSCANASNSS